MLQTWTGFDFDPKSNGQTPSGLGSTPCKIDILKPKSWRFGSDSIFLKKKQVIFGFLKSPFIDSTEDSPKVVDSSRKDWACMIWFTLPETNMTFSHLKMDGWNMFFFHLGFGLFSGANCYF